jgi:hypothetical protein
VTGILSEIMDEAPLRSGPTFLHLHRTLLNWWRVRVYEDRGHKVFRRSTETTRYLSEEAATVRSIVVDPAVEKGLPLKVKPGMIPSASNRSVMIIFPALPKSHSAFKVYLPIGESLLI